MPEKTKDQGSTGKMNELPDASVRGSKTKRTAKNNNTLIE